MPRTSPATARRHEGALVRLAGFPEGRLSVIPNGTDTGGEPERDAAADVEAARMLGARRHVELLHVGSTIPRKRIDVLLDVFAGVRQARPEVRLTRVGGPFTAEQRVRARELGVLDAIHVLPFVDRATLGAVYRRSSLALLTSDREGFGLPIVEALACGTPMVASDISNSTVPKKDSFYLHHQDNRLLKNDIQTHSLVAIRQLFLF